MSTRITITIATMALALSGSAALAVPYSYQTIVVPPSGVVNGINNNGQVVGTVGTQAFSANLATGAATIYPQAGFSTTGQAINNIGQIAGSYAISGSDVQYVRDLTTGAVANYRNFSGFIQFSNAAGINDAGIVVGYFSGSYHSSDADQSYIFNTATGALTAFADPSTGTGSSYYLVDPNMFGYTHAAAVNDAGTIVGTSLLGTSAATKVPAGFIYDPASGSYTHLTVPGSSATAALGINDNGQIVGSYTLNGLSYGFVFDQATGLYTTLADPAGVITAAVGINDAGQVIGQYTDTNGTTQNFLATPAASTAVPEPSSIVLLAAMAGLLGFGGRCPIGREISSGLRGRGGCPPA